MWNIINNYLNSIVTTFGYNILYFFSYFQIKYNHLHKTLISDVGHKEVLLVDLFDIDLNKIINIKMRNLKNESYDCMIITKDAGIHPYDKIIIQEKYDFPLELKWNNIKYKFLSLIVVIPDVTETYDIKLHSKTENYYIAGNIIDENFIKYYLAKYYKYKISKDISYKLQLIDQNVKINVLSMDKKINLLENNYEIN
jgi:hypothetical protein